MLTEADFPDAAETRLPPNARAELYRGRATALLAEMEQTELPRLREKLFAAASHFIALAEGVERLAVKRHAVDGHETGAVDQDRRQRILDIMGDMQGLLSGSADVV